MWHYLQDKKLFYKPRSLLTALLLLSISSTPSAGTTIITSDTLSLSPMTSRGMLIDAGSGGSRMHIYKWEPRIFESVPPPISYPDTDEKYAGKMDVGLGTISLLPRAARGKAVADHLAPLIDFAKQMLSGEEALFGGFPIFLKATGGMRELSLEDREDIMSWVRVHLADKSFNPFFFRNEMARVISGEEEAVFSWTAMNFLLGNLLTESEGIGEAFANSTIGTLDLGGSSTQIAFFIPSQDISEGLYKLQIGGHKHWNVYAKSFLTFGVVSARRRHLKMLADENDRFSVVAPCFHAGYKEVVVNSQGKSIEVSGPSSPLKDQYSRCYNTLVPLMEKDVNGYCNVVYHGECSIGGVYQPGLPKNSTFVGSSAYKFPWKILQLPRTASFELWTERAMSVCSMSFAEVNAYAVRFNITIADAKMSDMMPYFCFLAVYPLVLIKEGYGFPDHGRLTVVDDVNGNKAGWALGAIMHEINSLPWELRQAEVRQPWGLIFLSAVVGLGVGAAVAFSISKELLVDPLMLAQREGGYGPVGMYRSYHTPPASMVLGGGESTPPRFFGNVRFHDAKVELHIQGIDVSDGQYYQSQNFERSLSAGDVLQHHTVLPFTPSLGSASDERGRA